MSNHSKKSPKTIHTKEERRHILFLVARLIHGLAYKGISLKSVRQILYTSSFGKDLHKNLVDVGILRVGVDGLYYRGTQEPNEKNIIEAQQTYSKQIQSRFDKSNKEIEIKEPQNYLPEIGFEENTQIEANLEPVGMQVSYQEFLEYRQFLAWKKSQNN